MLKFALGFLGLLALLPWNITINIAQEYFIEYRLSTTSNSSASIVKLQLEALNDIVIIAQAMMFVTCISSIFHRPKRGQEILYIVVCSVISAIGFVVSFVLSFVDSTSWKASFMYVNYFLISVMQVASGWLEVSLVSMAGIFQEKDNYFPAIITGMNLCGVITTIFFVILKLVNIVIWKLMAIYYGLAILFCIGALALCKWIGKRPLYSKSVDSDTITVAPKKRIKTDLKRLWIAFKICYPAAIATFLVYTVTLIIFPVFNRVTAPLNPRNQLPDEWFQIICTFVVFNFLALVASPMPEFFKFPSRKYILIPAILRIIYIPLSMYCNCFPEIRQLRVVFPDWFYICISITMSLSHGYYSSLAAFYCPEYAPGFEREAGYLTTLFTVSGLLAGGFLSKLFVFIVTKK